MKAWTILAVAVLSVAGCRDASKSGPAEGKEGAAAATAVAKRTYGRNELRRLVDGKTPAELVGLIGRPASSASRRDAKFRSDPYSYTFLTYEGLSTDPYTGKPERVTIKLAGTPEKVFEVRFGDEL